MNTWKGAGIVLFNSEHQRVLLLRRQKDGLWSVPGGKVNEGEYPWDAAIRETYEETGFRISSPFFHLGVNNHFLLLGKNLRFFRSPRLNPIEHSAYSWAKRGALPEPLYPGMRDFIEKAFISVE